MGILETDCCGPLREHVVKQHCGACRWLPEYFKAGDMKGPLDEGLILVKEELNLGDTPPAAGSSACLDLKQFLHKLYLKIIGNFKRANLIFQ